jgi:hypothetical protein
VNGGTIDNAVIGGTTRNAGSFTSVSANADSSFTSTGALTISKGTSAQQPGSPTVGMLRFNTDLLRMEWYNGTAWVSTAPRGYIAGLTLSTAGSSSTFAVAAGDATDSTAQGLMQLTASISKTTSSWAVGTGNGSLDTGTIANTTWYHVFLIRRLDTGVVDVLISTSATAPTMPANYTWFRRIGSMRTNSSGQWSRFFQDGDRFEWETPFTSFGPVSNPGTAAVLRGLAVPTNVNVVAEIGAAVQLNAASAQANCSLYFSDPACADIASNVSTGAQIMVAKQASDNYSAGMVRCRTDTSGNVRTRVNASDAQVAIYGTTLAWIDGRGKDA